jgi:hypothetical protein
VGIVVAIDVLVPSSAQAIEPELMTTIRTFAFFEVGCLSRRITDVADHREPQRTTSR